MKITIGLVGKPLAGKETVGDIIIYRLRSLGHTVKRQRFGDLLRETLTLWKLEITRQNLQKLAQIMTAKNAFGADALSNAIRNRFLENEADVILADGVRWLADEKMIKSLPDKRGIILQVSADIETRFYRARERKREGEDIITPDQFTKEDRALNEAYIDDIGSRADWKIDNNSYSLGKLEIQVYEFLNKLVLPKLK